MGFRFLAWCALGLSAASAAQSFDPLAVAAVYLSR